MISTKLDVDYNKIKTTLIRETDENKKKHTSGLYYCKTYI